MTTYTIFTDGLVYDTFPSRYAAENALDELRKDAKVQAQQLRDEADEIERSAREMVIKPAA